ncbi:MAG TPA: hypothetical protein VN634_21680 [Candidatus Limnocylindrales bacterium]|nr:hypothetical protein [Candidatus Limnocylindrales bacterium]
MIVAVLVRAAALAALLFALPRCGGDGSVCTDLNSNPPDCEICSNGRDDDLDGDTDCDDSECDDAGVCRDEKAADAAVTTSTVTGGM